MPWLLDENKSFLLVHETIDIETGEILNEIADIDKRVKGAVRWLMATSYPMKDITIQMIMVVLNKCLMH